MHTQVDSSAAGSSIFALLGELGRLTDEPGRLTRTFLSSGMRAANALVGDWMRDAGLRVSVDSVGNLVGRLESPRPEARTLLMGSHLDTVPNAGRFDGALGVVLPVLVLAELRRRGVVLPFSVEVLGFSEEEGVRFAAAHIGSEGYTGQLPSSMLELRDADGVSVRSALKRFNDGVFLPPEAAHRREELLGYLEVHIEQGPVLEARGLAVGVVSAMVGQSRFKLTWTGSAGHAGTTPMNLRRDALAGAAEFVLATEKMAQAGGPLVATVGSLSISPGAANVVPGAAVHTLDLRHPRDTARHTAVAKLERLGQRIARGRGLELAWESTQDNDALACDKDLTALLSASVKAVQGENLALVSGAGHDGQIVSRIAPVAMLFVRCREGLSHHPDEYASPEDVGVAFDVTVDFLRRLASRLA